MKFLRRSPVAGYFGLTFSISWLAAFAVGSRSWLHGESPPKFAGLMMFPAMLLGPSIAGMVMTKAVHGTLRDLFSRMRRIGPARWLAMLLLPPALVASVLLVLETFVSPVFEPNLFVVGFAFGLSAGFFEEIGWTGFAFPAMRTKGSSFQAAVLLGLLWGLWHAPVIDYLGAATPHGKSWLPFFIAFTVAMTAMRVLICWVYSNTTSVLIAQLIHASSTGALATFSPVRVNAQQEALWYFVYAAALWAIVAAVVYSNRKCPQRI